MLSKFLWGISAVKVCTLYGAGFYYIPGSDTCIRVGGYVRLDATFNGGVYDLPAYSGSLGGGDRFADRALARSRMQLIVDTRTATEYGVVRTFAQGDFQQQNFGTQNGASASSGPGGGIGAAPGTPVTAGQLSGLNNALLSGPGAGYVARLKTYSCSSQGSPSVSLSRLMRRLGRAFRPAKPTRS